MIPTVTRLTFDLDEAARAAYESRSPGPAWADLTDTERADWHRVAAAVIETYDPVTFGAMASGMRTLWKIVGPVVTPYLSLMTRPDTKPGESSCTEGGTGRRGAVL